VRYLRGLWNWYWRGPRPAEPEPVFRLAPTGTYLIPVPSQSKVEDIPEAQPVEEPAGPARYSVELHSADKEHWRIVTLWADTPSFARQIVEEKEMELEAAGYERYWLHDVRPDEE